LITTDLPVRPSGEKLVAWAADRAINDFGYFLKWVTTIDESEPNPKKRVKRFPSEIPYVQYLARHMQDDKLLWVPKSRRLMLTWMNAAYMVWASMQRGYHGFVQTRNEDQAAWLIKDRCWFIYEYLPTWLKYVAFDGKTTAYHKHCKLTMPNGSKIWGVPQGSEQFRGYTATGVFIDEAASHDVLEQSLAAILPLREKGSHIIIVSSAQPGFFAEVVTSEIDGRVSNPMRGIQRWKLMAGGTVVRVHYTADPNKDPDRHGRDWWNLQVSEAPGGERGSYWQQEFEIDFHAYSGTRVYKEFTNEPPQIVAPFVPPPDAPKWRAIDYGLRNPTACLWITRIDNEYYVYREFFQNETSVTNLKDIIAAMSGDEQYLATWIDPSTDDMREADTPSVYWLLNQPPYALRATKGRREATGRIVVQQWLHDGRFHVVDNCANTRREMVGYRYEDWSPTAAKRHAAKEAPLKKDDHTMDAIKMFANGVRTHEAYVAPKKAEHPDIFPVDIFAERRKLATQNASWMGRQGVFSRMK
jgi:hypothetical protein